MRDVLGRPRAFRAIWLCLVTFVVVAGCAEQLGCFARMGARKARVSAYRFEASPEALAPEAVKLLERKGYHVQPPATKQGTVEVASSWRYNDRHSDRRRLQFVLSPDGEGTKSRCTDDRQDLVEVRWEEFARSRYEEAEQALLERLGGTMSDDEEAVLQALSKVLRDGGDVLIRGLGTESPEGWRFHTRPRPTGPEERTFCTGLLVLGSGEAGQVEIVRVHERALDIETKAPQSSFRNEELELDLIRQVDRPAGDAIHQESNKLSSDVSEGAQSLGWPSCTGSY